MKRKSRKKGGAARVALIVLCVFLALILVALIAGAIYLDSLMNLIGRVNSDTQSTMSSSEEQEYLDSLTDPTQATDGSDQGEETYPSIDPTDVTWATSTDPVIQTENIINILIIGQDAREGQSRQRSDSMILCTVNKTKKTLTLTSFMRDLYVQIPGKQDNRINASYAFGGMNLLDETLAVNFGVHVDGNVEVDFTGFMDIVDMLGGIDIELTQAEANYLNQRGNWDVNPGSAGKWKLKEGMNHLTGEQALAYSRIRYVGNADFGRTERQRKVLTILVDKCKNLNILELNSLLQKVLPMITTDLNNSEILGYALEVFPLLSDLTIETLRIPANGAYSGQTIRGMSVLVPDLEKNRELLKAVMAETGE